MARGTSPRPDPRHDARLVRGPGCLCSSGKRPREWVGVVWGAQERAGVPSCLGRQRLRSPRAPCPAPWGPLFLVLAKQSPCLAPLTQPCAAWLLGPSSIAFQENQPGRADHQLSHSHIFGIFVEHLLRGRHRAT